jgi:hypothetical protein
MRDKILAPLFYSKWAHSYILLDGPEHLHLQQEGIDTIAVIGNERITIEEKIVRWAEPIAAASGLTRHRLLAGSQRSVHRAAALVLAALSFSSASAPRT